jgi:3-oxoacyl-[acyl-carrier-protein] synthase I
MKRNPAEILGAGAVCAIGGSVAQIDASVRMGYSAMQDSAVHDRYFEPIKMALVPEDQLAPLDPRIDALPLTARQRRMLRLATPALQEAVEGLTDIARAPLYLGLPEAHPNRALILDPGLIKHLSLQTSVPFDAANSRKYARGRAAGLIALDEALSALHERRYERIIVGGVDTFLDLALLGELDAEKRLLGARVMDGFVPGEGAAFIVLGPAQRTTRCVSILGAGTAVDKGHRYGDEPAKGEGLSEAIENTFANMTSPPSPISTTFASLNGESFGAKEWGVARLRHASHFQPNADIVHPADCTGDTGAAAGTLLLAIAQHQLIQQTCQGPILAWATSDGEDCASAYLTAPT